MGKWFPQGFCAHSSPHTLFSWDGGQSVCSSWESVFIPRCGQGNLCTRALPDDCAQNKTAAEWTCLSVSPGNAELISGPYSKDEWDGVAHLGDPQQLGSSSPAACVLWVFRAQHLSSVLDPNCLLDRGSCHFSLSPSTTEGSSGAKEAFRRATDRLDSLVISQSLLQSLVLCPSAQPCRNLCEGGRCIPSACLSVLTVNQG